MIGVNEGIIDIPSCKVVDATVCTCGQWKSRGSRWSGMRMIDSSTWIGRSEWIPHNCHVLFSVRPLIRGIQADEQVPQNTIVAVLNSVSAKFAMFEAW